MPALGLMAKNIGFRLLQGNKTSLNSLKGPGTDSVAVATNFSIEY